MSATILAKLGDFSTKYNYGWTRSDMYALYIFLQLKIQLNDWDAKVLSPSARVDELWHTFVLHTQDYLTFCNTVSVQKKFLHHRPEGKNELDQANRYLTSWLLIRHQYENHEAEFAEYWPKPTKENDEPVRKAAKPTSDVFSNVFVKTLDGIAYYIGILPQTTLYDLYLYTGKVLGKQTGTFRLIYAGNTVPENDLTFISAWNPNLNNESVFHVVDRLRGC